MNKYIGLLLMAFALGTVIKGVAQTNANITKAKAEIMAAEKAFCKMAKESGVEVAFLAFAADDAVICRSSKFYKGKVGITEFYKRTDKKDVLSWKPDFVSVSESCDMAYSYGEYDFSGVRVGNTVTDHGTYQTIWKKQKDGTWKFVFD